MKLSALILLIAYVCLIKTQIENIAHVMQECKQVCNNRLSTQQLIRQQQTFDKNDLALSMSFITDSTHLVKKIFYYKWYVRKPWRQFISNVTHQIYLFTKWISFGIVILLTILLYGIYALFNKERKPIFIQKYLKSLRIFKKRKILKITIITLLLMCILSIIILFQGIIQNQTHQKSINTFICNKCILNLTTYLHQIQTHTRQFQQSYLFLESLINNRENLKQMIQYGDNLYKIIDKQNGSTNNVKQDFHKQIIILNETLIKIDQFNSAHSLHNNTIQLLRKNLILIKVIKNTLLKYVHHYIPLQKVSSKIVFVTNILYYLLIISFTYIIAVVFTSYKRRNSKFYKKWTLIPFILFIIIICCFIISITASILSPTLYYLMKSYQNLRYSYENVRSNMDIPRTNVPPKQWVKYFQFNALVLVKNAKIQNIYEKDYLNNKISELNLFLQHLKAKKSNYYANLYQNSYALAQKESNHKMPKDIPQFRNSPLQHFINNTLQYSINQALKGINQIVMKQLTTNSKIDAKSLNEQIYEVISNLIKFSLNGSQYNRRLFMQVGYLSLFGFICLTIIRKLIINITINKNFIANQKIKNVLNTQNQCLIQSNRNQYNKIISYTELQNQNKTV